MHLWPGNLHRHLSTFYKELLTHWGRVTHICVGKLTNIGSDNGLSPGRRQAIIWTNAEILLIGPAGTIFSEILIEIHTFSFKKMHLKMSSGKAAYAGWTGPTLVQIMPCRLFCAKTLPETMLTYCQLDPQEQTSVRYGTKYKMFSSWKWIWKWRLRNGVQGGMGMGVWGGVGCGLHSLGNTLSVLNTFVSTICINKFAYAGTLLLKSVYALMSSGTFMRQQTRPSLPQIMACCLTGPNPLSEPMLEYCQWDIWGQISMKSLRLDLLSRKLSCYHCLTPFVGPLRSWWRNQMETFSALLAICAGNSPVTGEEKGQWRGALIFLWSAPEQTIE